ncbi:MAG TPA: response regulator [Methylomirabilota bacterium]|nr:response regulator [Methylomirabilota bacterium]
MAEPRARILNVDDYEAGRYARSQVLLRAGFEVIDASTGVDALRLATEAGPDLVLLDIDLPDIDGFEVCRRLRAQRHTHTIPIVHVSPTFLGDRAQDLAYEGGADGYLTDPVEPAVLLATIHSLLRLRRAEEGLRAASRGWQATFDSIGDGICLLSATATVSRCNGAFATLFGLPAAEVVGLPWSEVWRKIGGEAESPLPRVERSRQRETVDFPRGPSWFRLQVDPALEGETVSGMVCLLSDITIERQATDVRVALFAREQEAREEAEAINRAKDEFLAMLGHELRNPLDVIGSAVRVLESLGDREPSTRQAREVIGRQVRQLGRLVDDLLDVGRVTTGKISLVRVPVNLAETVGRCVDGLSASSQALQHEVTVDAEPVWIDADQARVEQIVMNLLSNAVKYTPAGGHIEISVTGDGQTARLAVKDTGAGLAPHMVDRVFDLFFQGERTLDRSEGGLGIGLTLVRRIAELHGGRADAHSAGPGRGSTFSVDLPQRAGPEAAGGAPEAGAAVSPRRIVIVEDSRDSRDMLRFLLERAGHQVHEAVDGPSGVTAILTHRPDIALVDVGLPGLDGYEVARRVRAEQGGQTVRLVALTGYGLPEDQRRSHEAGFDGHLVKPVEPTRLQAAISAARPR